MTIALPQSVKIAPFSIESSQSQRVARTSLIRVVSWQVCRFVCEVGIYEAISVASCCSLEGEGLGSCLDKDSCCKLLYNPFFSKQLLASLLGGTGNRIRDKISRVKETAVISTTPQPPPLLIDRYISSLKQLQPFPQLPKKNPPNWVCTLLFKKGNFSTFCIRMWVFFYYLPKCQKGRAFQKCPYIKVLAKQL